MSNPAYPRPFGPYVLLERLGQGGMSEVDLARRMVDDAAYVRFVVIKRIHAAHSGDDSFVRMFHDEARINAELQHENIATVYDFGQEGDEFFLAMEYVAGCDLRRVQRLLVRKGESFPLRVALRIVADVLAALDYAHSRVDTYGRNMNVVHRDVNPRNVMLSLRGEVKLIDFGVAKADNRAEHTVGHSLKGKFAYMAPEQIDAARPVDGRADVFAVGIVLHELLTNASPFAGLTEVQTMHRILAGQIPSLAANAARPVPPSVLAVHDRALATDPDRRFATAGAMRDAVLAAAQEVGGLCSRAELADFLRQVDPDASSVSHRLEEWRQGSPAERSVSRSRSVALPSPAQTSSSGTLSTRAAPPPPPRSLLRAALVGGGLGLVLLATALLLWLLRPVPPGEAPTHSSAGQATTGQGTTGQASTGRGTTGEGTTGQGTTGEGTTAEGTTGQGTASVGTTGQGTTGASLSPPLAPPADPHVGDAAGASTATSSSPPPGDAADHGAAPATAPSGQATATPPPDPLPSEPVPPLPDSTSTASTSTAGSATAGSNTAGSSTAGSNTAASTGQNVGPSGFLNISSRPTGLELTVDGRPMGRTPVRALELPVGAHTLVVRDPASGRTWQQQVQVDQGRARLVVLGEGE